MSGVFSRDLDLLLPSGAGWQSFHFAENLSFTQFVIRAKSLYCV